MFKRCFVLIGVLGFCLVLCGCSQNVNGSFNGGEVDSQGYTKVDANWSIKTEKDQTLFKRDGGLTFSLKQQLSPVIVTDSQNEISIFSNDELTFRIFNTNQEEAISKIENSNRSVFEDGDVKYYTSSGSDYAIIVWKDKVLYMSITLENGDFSSGIEEYAKEFSWNV